MALVIKTNRIVSPEGAEKLYRDALVTKGSLILHDYSNRGNLDNYNITTDSPVWDLARDASLDLEINNSTLSLAGQNELTEGKGLDRSKMTGTLPAGSVVGFDLGLDLANYLVENQPRSVFTAWVRRPTTAAGRILSMPTSEGIGWNATINFGGSEYTVAMSFAGAAGLGIAGDRFHQVSLEFIGIGQPLNIYVDGEFYGNSTGDATGFSAPSASTKIGRFEGSLVSNPILYRFFIEDLDISGRTALEVVKKDWDYCNGIGEYIGLPTKRPFIDNI